jgi:transitional endoplasmic reticulum ATPase
MAHATTSDEAMAQTDIAVAEARVYSTFKDRCSGLRWGVDFILADAIRTAHIGLNVTPISARSCDLVGFAKAGHAIAALITNSDKYLSERVYVAPANRLEGGLGKLDDKVKYGRYHISYQGQGFDFYVAQWPEKYQTIRMCYILSHKDRPSSVLDDLLLAASKWTSELHEEIYVFDDGCWDKNKKLWTAVQSSTWDDVILDPVMKDTLITDVQNFFDSKALYEEYAVPWKRGIILHGTPGCGKTISIKALMNTLDKRDTPVASLYVKTFQTCRGLHYSIREIFSKARAMAPCLLVFEDLDSLVVEKVRSYFLNEVDGLEENNGILMIGSTNHLNRLDPGISKRPSRFDRKYHFKIPGARERVLYCEYWKKKLERNSSVDFEPKICDVVAQLTDGFSFAYLKELFVQTLLTIVGGRESELDGGEEEAEISEGELVDIADEAKIIEGSTKLAVGGEKVTSVEGEEASEKAKKKAEIKAPTVDIPEQLRSNPLMRILHKQALALWKDMDNTKDEEAGVKKGTKEDDDADADSEAQWRMLHRTFDDDDDDCDDC